MDTLTLRPLRRDDIPAVHAVVRAAEVSDRRPLVTPVAELEEVFDEPHLDPDADTRVAELGGRVAGWIRLWHNPSGVRLERTYLVGCVDPAMRRRGIGGALFGWGMARAREVMGAYRHGLPCYIRHHSFDWETDQHALARRHGMQPVRYGEELLRPLDSLPARSPIEGVEILPWGDEHAEPTRRVANAAFADHWGSTEFDAAAWRNALTTHGKRLDLSFVAVSDGTVVGFSRNANFPDDEALLGRRDGWIDLLAVLRAHRKRGIASRLIAESLHAFRRAGLTHAMLGVDSENPTGAAGLYRALGFVTQLRSITHELQL